MAQDSGISGASVGAPGVVLIVGKIKSTRVLEDSYGETRVGALVVCDPVADAPRSMVEVFSKTSLGPVGTPVRLNCRLTGAPNWFNVPDDHGGTVRVQTARHYLNVVA